MSQNLNFDTGIITLNIQGDASRQLKFNPNDFNLANRFFELVQHAEEKQKEFTEKGKAVDESNDLEAKLNLITEMDKYFRSQIDILFGEDSAELIFKDMNLMTEADNGDFILANFLMALYPYFEKASKKKVDQIIKDHKLKSKKK